MEYAVRSGALALAEIVELNPTLADGRGDRQTAELGRQLANALLREAIF